MNRDPLPDEGGFGADNWKSLGEIAKRIAEKEARQRCSAPGLTARKENGDE